MKDLKYILLFVIIGLALAFATSEPLRKKTARALRATPPVPSSTSQPGSAGDDDRIYVHGTINVAATLPLDITHRALFIIATPAAGGEPIAFKRVDTAAFPLTFVLTPANNTVGNDFYEDDLVLTVRLDQDGVAGPKQPGDVEASTAVPAASDRRVAVTLTN